MVPRQTGHVGCSSPASGVLDEKGIIGVSPGASGYRRIGMLVRVCSQRKRVLLCGKSLRQRNIGRPRGPAIMASNNDSRHIDRLFTRGAWRSVSKRNDRHPGRKGPSSPLLATDPRPVRVAAVGARKIPIKVEIV
jgi:hypothetical protein